MKHCRVWALVFLLLMLPAAVWAGDPAERSPFLKLCAEGSPSAIWKAVSTGAKVEEKDENGMTALMYAAAYNKNPLSAVELIRLGANVHARSNDTLTPLMWAAALNPTTDVIISLLQAGAEVNDRTDNGWTALMWAAYQNPNPKVIVKLLDAGADPTRGRLGKKALDFARARPELKGTEALHRLENADR